MYRIIISTRAMKDMRKVSADMRRKIDGAINMLSEHPFVGKKLHADFEGLRSLRVWPYRIIYAIDRHIVTVTVLRVGHRQGVYSS
jgi:mRNA interferase RelE/StbE